MAIATVGAAVVVWVAGGLSSAQGGPADPGQPAAAGSLTGPGFRFWARDEGRPVGWNPCRPIRWVLNPEGAPPRAGSRLRAAMARLTEATGIEFVFAGVTDEQPSRDREAYQPERYGQRWAPVLFAWTPPHHNGLPLRDLDRAVAVPVAVRAPGPDVFVTGQVVFTRRAGAGAPSSPPPGSTPELQPTILHELGHLAGLDHVDDPSQLMYRFPAHAPGQLGEGDRAGLRRLGRQAGCRRVPAPGPVEVSYAEPRRARTQPRS